jgi:hypothetical protein
LIDIGDLEGEHRHYRDAGNRRDVIKRDAFASTIGESAAGAYFSATATAIGDSEGRALDRGPGLLITPAARDEACSGARVSMSAMRDAPAGDPPAETGCFGWLFDVFPTERLSKIPFARPRKSA